MQNFNAINVSIIAYISNSYPLSIQYVNYED